MQLSLPQKDLAQQLQIVTRALPTRSTVSTVEGVLFSCDGQSLSLTATNLEMGIRTQMNVNTQAKGQVVLPGKITEIIRRLPGDLVSLTVNPENYLTKILSGQAEFEVYGLNAEDYPELPAFEPEQARLAFSVKTTDFRRALRQTLFAVSVDETKPAFTGVLFTLRDSFLQLVASDTFRLAATRCQLEKMSNPGEILVPAKSLQEVLRILPDDETVVQAAVIGNQLFLQFEDIIFSTRLIDENFPNVERVIPQDFIGEATIETENLLATIERAALLSAEENNIVHLIIGAGSMVVRAASKLGKIQESIPLELEGEGVEIALNVRFLLDMLKITEGHHCYLKITGPNKPCILKDSLDTNYLYLVLPIKL